ncbi:MAG: hypothetical protein M0R28_24115, partial [Pigmentiphaga sp.]|nr:hypothetical protein [Pigmentiphaga sp.]
VEDDAVRHVADEIFGERVFFPTALLMRKSEPAFQSATNMMAVVNCGPDKRRKTAFDAPERVCGRRRHVFVYNTGIVRI